MICEFEGDKGGKCQINEARQHQNSMTPMFILQAFILEMYPEPSYLDLDQELYPTLTLFREIIIDNPQDHFHRQISQRVAYDSHNRIIELTEALRSSLLPYYKHVKTLEIYVYDPITQNYEFLSYFHNQSINLGEQFLQLNTLLFRVNEPQEQAEESEEEEGEEEEPVFEAQAAGGVKSRKRRTIREMLIVVDKFRKWQSSCKGSMQEYTDAMGMSCRTLELYLHNVKLGEKYSFPFQEKLDCKLSVLQKFLKEKSAVKKKQELAMLAKLKNYFK